jgi:hypothetical protein
VPAKYSADSDPIPFITWREMTLILAEKANTVDDDQATAIAHINTLRAFHGLPQISGSLLTALTDGTNDQLEVRMTILEETRREYFAEGGRYWSVKIQNTDALWFPRKQARTPTQNYLIRGGVRLQFPNDEYTNNPNFNGLPDRGTVCAPEEAPIP